MRIEADRVEQRTDPEDSAAFRRLSGGTVGLQNIDGGAADSHGEGSASKLQHIPATEARALVDDGLPHVLFSFEMNWDLRYGLISHVVSHCRVATERSIRHCWASGTGDKGHSRGACRADPASSERSLPMTAHRRDTPAGAEPAPRLGGLLDHVGCHASRSMRRMICAKR